MLRRISEMKAVTGPGYPSAAATLAARRDWVARFSFPVRSPTHALARPALARAHALARPVLTRAARCTPRPSPHQEKGNPNWNVRKVFSDTDRQYFAAALKLFGELGWPQDDDLLATMFADAAANMKDPATGALGLTDPDTGKPYLFRRAAHTPRSARTPPRAPQSPRPTLRMALAPRAPRAVHSEGFMRDFSREFPCHALGCALLAWCAAADRLRRALPWQTEVLVLEAVAPHGTARSLRNKKPSSGAGSCAENTARLPHDCPGAVTLRPSAALVAHVAAHVAAQVRRQPQRRLDFLRRMGGQLYKWELFSLTRLDAVLFADLDVDLFPPRLSAAAVAAEWAGRAAAGDLRRAAAHPPRRSARLFLAHKRRPLPPAALGGALPRRPARPRRGLRRANRLEPQRHPR